ncbi:hypothetical protein [Streptomyces benahoarensis]|uniref:Uncharacterized protein n=1 Tax=Streptomyces benahoarensis TaxID=2595054 RepID=A0A553ZL25_9ACTN|nr:hypothetical protein [Streptomyces benahoarensis]TSB26631.1 hypothetical protein FNJ62_11080 [Streptomyces benahoarensis]TSB42171.1 hypothetical protein FNZ23_11335 [Streptomyces benahoarensis]
MNGLIDTTAAEPKPEFWYGLPYGYLPLDLQPTPEGIQETARQITLLPPEHRDRADQIFRLYASVLTMLRKREVMGCALGMHPDDDGEPTLSVLTVSTVATTGANPNAVLMQLLGGDSTGTSRADGIVPVEIPVGTGYVWETVRRTPSPAAPPEGSEEGTEEESREGTVWQGTVAIPRPGNASIVMLQLVTPAVEWAQDYRGVLLGVARTVSFTDPAEESAANGNSGPSAAPDAAERSPFG